MSIQKVINDYLHHISEAKQPSTIKRYRYDLVQFTEWLQKTRKDDKMIKLPTQEEISSYYLYLKGVGTYSPNTIRRILSVLRFWLQYAGDTDGSNHIGTLIKKTKLIDTITPLPFFTGKKSS
ncbi:MAG: phage integrase N-terminal SAM-like domain-containing protein [Bacillus sp. (in: Bacteria)]|nr:phage integrase N-terminal SAM-like domain-containing protein [Bacillus sp. (in: firmicutes)]